MPYPASADQLTTDLALHLQEADPVLLQIIAGTAPATVQLQVADGSLPDAAPTPQERQAEANRQQIEAIVSQGNPYGSQGRYAEDGSYVPGDPGNVTAALALEALDPDLATRLKLEAHPPKAVPGVLNEADASWVNQQLAGARQ